jgi:hexokinase
MINVIHQQMTASTATPLSPSTSALFPRLANPFAPRTTPDVSDTSLSSRAQSFLANVDQQFVSPLSTQRLLSLSAALHKSYVGAASTSSAQMLPSHITTLPSGRESGQYVAVDLGGTNMRVALVRLQDNEATVEKLDKWIIPEQVKTGTAEDFFQWVAERIVKLTSVSVLDDGEQEWKLGVTWSFPFA